MGGRALPGRSRRRHRAVRVDDGRGDTHLAWPLPSRHLHSPAPDRGWGPDR